MDLRLNPGRQYGQRHAGNARQYTAARCLRCVHPIERKNEQHGRRQISELLDRVLNRMTHVVYRCLLSKRAGGYANGIQGVCGAGEAEPCGAPSPPEVRVWRNIFSMRSVIRKPLTMFVIEAKSAI